MDNKRLLAMLPVIALVIVSYSMLPVYAAHSQGFSWGVSEGDTFDYRIKIERNTEPTYSKNEAYNVTIGALPNIPDPVSSLYPVSVPCTYCWIDGNSFAPNYDFSLFRILPIGNWDVFTDYIEDTYDDVTVNDDFNQWGYSYTDLTRDNRQSFTVWFEKNTGLMTSLLYEDKLIIGGDIIETFEVTKIGIPGIPMELVPIVIIGAVILGCCICRKKD